MRLATLNDGTRDGRLVLVSADGGSFAQAPVHTLQEALDNWNVVAPQLASVSTFPEPLDPIRLMAPLPRAWQWLDGSVYSSHGALMDKALGVEKPPVTWPLMYQGVSDKFYGPTDDVRLPDEALQIDFEGEFGVIVDAVPMGTSPAECMKHIKLVVQINDWSLRALAGPEMKTGFGWVQAKPHCTMAPFAVTPTNLAMPGGTGAAAPTCSYTGMASGSAPPMANRWAMASTNWSPMPPEPAIWQRAR